MIAVGRYLATHLDRVGELEFNILVEDHAAIR